MPSQNVIPSQIDADERGRTWAEVDLAAIKHNARVIQKLSGSAHVMAVVKANAYGHGDVRVAEALPQAAVSRFAVATIPEARRLREGGIEAPIVVLGAPVPGRIDMYETFDAGIVVSSADVAEALANRPSKGGVLRAHIKVDTGMGRLGIRPDELERVLSRLERISSLRVESIWTHFATADDPNSEGVTEQLERFDEAVHPFRDDVAWTHVANSGALLNHRDKLTLDERSLVRPGIALYGLSPSQEEDQAAANGLIPAMHFRSTIMHVKDVEPGTPISYGRRWQADGRRRIATVAAGYADGVPRALTNIGRVRIGNAACPIAGTVCMDMLMVDVGEVDSAPDLTPGDVAELFGRDEPSCFDVARAAGTIPYEIVCRISERVRRFYYDSEADSGTG